MEQGMKISSGDSCVSTFIRGYHMVTKKNTADMLLVTKALVTGKLPVTGVSYLLPG